MTPSGVNLGSTRGEAAAPHHDAVLDGEVVGRQALEVPLADLGLVHEEARDVQGVVAQVAIECKA